MHDLTDTIAGICLPPDDGPATSQHLLDALGGCITDALPVECVMPAARQIRPSDISVETIQSYRKWLGATMSPGWFGIGIESDTGKHIPIHRNTRTDPAPRMHTSPQTGKQWKVLDHLKYYLWPHLAGIRPLFHLSSALRSLGMMTWDCDADGYAMLAETSAYMRGIIRSLWSHEPFMEPGRSYPRKQGCYARQLLDFRGIPAFTRNLSERLINRFVKALHPRGERAGYQLDGLKGTTTWVGPNSRYCASPRMVGAGKGGIMAVQRSAPHGTTKVYAGV